jgi:hypothetical protein
MKETEMRRLGNLLGHLLLEDAAPSEIAREVAALRRAFDRIDFSFDSELSDYSMILRH